MNAVWFRARAEIRQRWRALVSLAILSGLFGAVVLASLAGARRTERAYPPFMDRQLAWDIIIADSTPFGDVFWKPDFPALEHLPYVESWAPVSLGGLVPYGTLIAGTDTRYGSVINRYKVVAGRLPNPDAADEIAVPHFADGAQGSLHVGDHPSVTLGGKKVMLHVVGETVGPGDLPPQPLFGWELLASPAFLTRYRQGLDFALTAVALRFKHRSDIATFERDVRAMTGGKVFAPVDQSTHALAVKSSTALQTSALRLLALFTAITAMLILAQALARETALASDEVPWLRALGMSRGQIFGIGIARALPIALGSMAVAVGAAWLASPLFPQGSVRLAEIAPGFRFDAQILGPGALCLLFLLLGISAIPAWRATISRAREEVPSRPSGAASFLSRVGMSVAAVSGARLAFERGRGRTAVPIASSLSIVALGIASFLAAMTFAGSLSTMLARPELHGKTWDKVVTARDGKAFPPAAMAALSADPGVDSIAYADSGAPMRVFSATKGVGPSRGIGVSGFIIQAVKGSVFPPVVEGRAPRGPGEVVVGARMIRALHLHLDSAEPPAIQVALEGGSKRATLRVVGRAIIPPTGNFGQFGFGVAFTDASDLNALAADAGGGPPTTDSLVRFRPGANPAAILAPIKKRFPQVAFGEELSTGKLADVVNFGGVQRAPLLVGGMLAVLGVAALAHVLLTAIRRRRRDIAILKIIGFVRGQARRTIAWQATFSALVAGAIGVPFGIIGGRWLWIKVAEGIGVLPYVRVPGLVLVLVAPALLVLANVIALLPARAAARTQPAEVLRIE